MGAFLVEYGEIVEFFSIPISDDAQQILETPSGTPDGQQLWECLTGLIAMGFIVIALATTPSEFAPTQ